MKRCSDSLKHWVT